MTHTYFFPEPGTISGIPGTFAGVQVEVDEETSEIIKVSPLARHPHFVPAPPEPEPTGQAEESVQSEQEASPPEQATEAAPSELLSSQPAQDAQPEASPPAEEAGSHTESQEA